MSSSPLAFVPLLIDPLETIGLGSPKEFTIRSYSNWSEVLTACCDAVYASQDAVVQSISRELRTTAKKQVATGTPVLPHQLLHAATNETALFVTALSDPLFVSFGHGLARSVASGVLASLHPLPSLSSSGKLGASLKELASELSSTSKTLSSQGSGGVVDTKQQQQQQPVVSSATTIAMPNQSGLQRQLSRGSQGIASRVAVKQPPMLKKLDLSALASGGKDNRTSHPQTAKADLGGGLSARTTEFTVTADNVPTSTRSKELDVKKSLESDKVPKTSNVGVVQSSQRDQSDKPGNIRRVGSTLHKGLTTSQSPEGVIPSPIDVPPKPAVPTKKTARKQQQSLSSTHAKGKIESCCCWYCLVIVVFVHVAQIRAR